MLVSFIFGIGERVTIVLPIFFYHNSAESLPRRGLGRVVTPSGIEDSIPLASPLIRGTKDPTLVPPLSRGARGDLESTASEIYYGFES